MLRRANIAVSLNMLTTRRTEPCYREKGRPTLAPWHFCFGVKPACSGGSGRSGRGGGSERKGSIDAAQITTSVAIQPGTGRRGLANALHFKLDRARGHTLQPAERNYRDSVKSEMIMASVACSEKKSKATAACARRAVELTLPT